MAEKRMFSRKIVESDAFLDMPTSAQALYLHLGMEADDDGVVNAPNGVRRSVGASQEDLRLLVVHVRPAPQPVLAEGPELALLLLCHVIASVSSNRLIMSPAYCRWV